jgi:hypothetical protein
MGKSGVRHDHSMTEEEKTDDGLGTVGDERDLNVHARLGSKIENLNLASPLVSSATSRRSGLGGQGQSCGRSRASARQRPPEVLKSIGIHPVSE